MEDWELFRVGIGGRKGCEGGLECRGSVVDMVSFAGLEMWDARKWVRWSVRWSAFAVRDLISLAKTVNVAAL